MTPHTFEATMSEDPATPALTHGGGGRDKTRAPARRQTWDRGDVRLLLLGVPGLMLIAVVLFYPLLDLLRLSATSGSFEPYATLARQPVYLKVVLNSLWLAACTACIALMLAYPLAVFLATTSPVLRTIGFVMVMLPFLTSLLVRSYAWMILLGRTGVVNMILQRLGLVDSPLPLMFNTVGVLVGTVHYLVPFMVLPIYAAYRKIDPSLRLAAEGLGASGWRTFLVITLPLTLRGVIAGTSMVFIIAASAFVTPALLGGGKVVMIANLIQMQVSQLLDWPLAGAMSVVVLVLILVAHAAFDALGRLAPRWGER